MIVNGTPVFYNSNSYHCREENLCKYGLLLYAIADLLPLTVMFVLLLAFIINVSLTSGTAYSVIFMIQQLHALDSITTSGAIQCKHYSFILMSDYGLTDNESTYRNYNGAKT